MPRADTAANWTELTLEERRERRRIREDNVKRAAKMHAARIKTEATTPAGPPELKQSVYVGCSGWRYWKWRGSFYAGVVQNDWFGQYLKRFDTVEINASFYSWPAVAGVQAWRRQPGKKKFVYTVKVCEHITHIKKFKGTKTLIRDFGMIADVLGDRMGCFLFQLPPSYRYTKTRLKEIVSQLDPARRNVVEFRHASWWNEEVYSAFRKAGIIFCSCSGPRLPDELIRTADEVYVRLHGPRRWYRHDYSKEELEGRQNRQVALSEPGSTSITITTPMRRKTPPFCAACLAAFSAPKVRTMELCLVRKRSRVFGRPFHDQQIALDGY